jgi:peptidoglycan-associated lipoprotein
VRRQRECLPVIGAVGVTIALVVGGFGCAHKKSVVAPEVAPLSPGSTTDAGAAASAGTTMVQPEPTVSSATTPEAGVASSALPTDLAKLNTAGYIKDGFFETDKSELRTDTRDAMAANAAWLKANPSVRILVEGHCDERNTQEYNLALGWRRANAAKDYLTSLGVAAERIATISYGEERPFAVGHDEAAWAQNRRAHFVITAR